MRADEAEATTAADVGQQALESALPKDVGYVLIVKTPAGLVVWNTNLDVQREAAAMLRALADDLEAHGRPPERPPPS